MSANRANLFREAARLSGCAWRCYAKQALKPLTESEYCSHCSMIADAFEVQIGYAVQDALRAASPSGAALLEKLDDTADDIIWQVLDRYSRTDTPIPVRGSTTVYVDNAAVHALLVDGGKEKR